MTLDDFSQSAEPVPLSAALPREHVPVAREDEDLFDFPVIEVTLESLRAEAAKDPSRITTPFGTATAASAPKPAPAAPPAPANVAPPPPRPSAAPRPAPAVAHATATAAPAPTAPAHVAAAAHVAPASHVAAAHAAPAPAAPPPRRAPPAPDVAQAAALVDDIEEALGHDLEANVVERGSSRLKRARSLAGTPAVWMVVGAGLVLNAGAFFLLWQSNRSFRHGIEGLRDELVLTVREMRLGASETRAAVPMHEPAAVVAKVPAGEPKLVAAPPIEPFEKTTLTLAAEEIKTGEYASARRRLYRLLAMADRIDEKLRGAVETEASYLLADSYREQADARREGVR